MIDTCTVFFQCQIHVCIVSICTIQVEQNGIGSPSVGNKSSDSEKEDFTDAAEDEVKGDKVKEVSKETDVTKETDEESFFDVEEKKAEES